MDKVIQMTESKELEKLRICQNCRYYDDRLGCDRLKTYETGTFWNFCCSEFKPYEGEKAYTEAKMDKIFGKGETMDWGMTKVENY